MLIRSMDEARVGQHLCQTYGSEDELHTRICEFVRSGLTASDLIIHVSGSDAATVDTYLAEAGVDARPAFERGQIQVISVADVEVDADGSCVGEAVDRLAAILAEREASGYAHARMASEVDHLTGTETPDQMVARERLGDALIAANPMVGLCLYDRRRHSTDFLLHAVGEHAAQVVTDAEWYRDEIVAIGPLDGVPGLRVTGQVDLSNRAALEAALRQTVLSLQGAGELVVDLAGTSFIDVAGLRALADTAEGNPGLQLVLRGPGSAIRRALHLAEWDRVANLVVAGGEGEP